MIRVGYDGSPAAERALNAALNLLHDPLRMARSLLAGKAVAAIVNAVDREHCEVVTTTAPADGRRAGL